MLVQLKLKKDLLWNVCSGVLAGMAGARIIVIRHLPITYVMTIESSRKPEQRARVIVVVMVPLGLLPTGAPIDFLQTGHSGLH